MAVGSDPATVAARVVAELATPRLRVGFVFADWRLDPEVIGRVTARGLTAPVVGGTTSGVVGAGAAPGEPAAVGFGLYGDSIRVGVGLTRDLTKSPLTGARDAVREAAAAIGFEPDQLDPGRHVGVTVLDGTCGQEESFCIGSAAAAPRIRFVGGCAATELGGRRSHVWVNGEVMVDAGAVVLLDSELPFVALSSSHLVATSTKTVVTAASGRVIHELDGRPAASRFRDLVHATGDTLDEPLPSHAFARFIAGVPYVRSIMHFDREAVHLASAVETGHVLTLMRPGDLIGTTRRDLAAARERVGGNVEAMLVFSCLGRHLEARSRGTDLELATLYGEVPAVGFQSFGEQSGMLLVNHTLTGLAIGRSR